MTRIEHEEDLPQEEIFVGGLFGESEIQSSNEIAEVSGLKISILEKTGLALTLISDQLFSPALVLSEMIHFNTIDVTGKRVLELGCGTGLVGLIALLNGAAQVCLTDYNDESILTCPRLNLERNKHLLPSGRCQVTGHTWGTDATPITSSGKFDHVILADILWYESSHADILQSVKQTLASGGVAWISSGKYTRCAEAFFALAEGDGWSWESVQLSEEWRMPSVKGVSNLDARKQNCLCWKMKHPGLRQSRVSGSR